MRHRLLPADSNAQLPPTQENMSIRICGQGLVENEILRPFPSAEESADLPKN